MLNQQKKHLNCGIKNSWGRIMVEIDTALDFLDEWKTRNEIAEKFDLGNTASYNLVKYLLKAGYIESIQMRVAHKTNRTWFYKRKKGR
jgi:predicted transcriptional regulator